MKKWLFVNSMKRIVGIYVDQSDFHAIGNRFHRLLLFMHIIPTFLFGVEISKKEIIGAIIYMCHILVGFVIIY